MKYVLITLLTIASVLAQDSTSVDDFSEFDALSDDPISGDSLVVDSLGYLLEAVQLEKLKYEKSAYTYYMESLDNRRKVFGWTHFSSVVIFWMVTIIVLFGLIFSTIQFRISMLNAQKKAASNLATEDESTKTGLKISMSGLEVNSSVLGIIILVISLAFFYLYLIYIYPVKEFQFDDKELPTVQNEQPM